MKPSCSQIEALAKDYSVNPVCREIYAGPLLPNHRSRFLRRLSQESRRYYLLESIEGGEKWGRYSFLGYDPVARITCKDSVVTIENGTKQVVRTDKPLDVLRGELAKYKAPKLEGMPPFTGGFVGYFSYAMIGYAEPVLKLQSSRFNDFDLMLFDKVIAYDHLQQKISIVVNMRTDQVLENYGKAVSEIEGIVRLIASPLSPAKERVSDSPEFRCNISREAYCAMVEKTKEHIVDGDIFQAVISRRFESEYSGSLLNAYRVLRTTNPSPYMVFMQTDDVQLISTSPENAGEAAKRQAFYLSVAVRGPGRDKSRGRPAGTGAAP
jgi:anthranilate synthase component 1